MHPYQHALAHPDHCALAIADTGEQLSYRELDRGSNRAAQLFRRLGLAPGERVALMLRNSLDYPVLYWGAQRSGLLAAILSTHLTASEAAAVVNDCGARVLILSAETAPAGLIERRGELLPRVEAVLCSGAAAPAGTRPLREALAAQPATPIADQVSGHYLLYSSGTTGRPKGILRPFKPGPIEEVAPFEGTRLLEGIDPLVTFNAGPMYHSAPLAGMLATQRLGGTAVTLRKFDALESLKAIERWRVVQAQFVPTMFVRMLALSDEQRRAYDLGSLKQVIHAAAPCAVEIKRRMMSWLGPIIHEYYSGSEAFGSTYISPEEWLRKPGSVGRSRAGAIHICADAGEELPTGAEGLIYFETPADLRSQYLNDPHTLARARHPSRRDWYTLGDIGRVDQDGYLFLTDRKDFMIISGGVNIYPQAAEDALILHPKVLDAAVIGVPNPEFGEEVKALVQPKDWQEANDALAAELIAWCRGRISALSCPRSVEFVPSLPRLASGKLQKHELRRRYGAPGGGREAGR
ncbi:MAG TPA: AMP-binding protein [Steroidobacteraceae bacterium]|nr:AMP-binding protein [Steroidobacteraceae bacterium]